MIATLWIGALAAALCCVLQDPAPEVEAAKARLRTAMSATAIAFEQSESGLSLLARFDHDGDRKQTVCVALAPNQTNGLVCHNIYTTVWIGAAAAPDEALMRRVFAQAKKLGAFYMLNEGGTWAIRFGLQFDATDLPETLSADHPRVKELRDLVRFVDAVGEETDAWLNGANDMK